MFSCSEVTKPKLVACLTIGLVPFLTQVYYNQELVRYRYRMSLGGSKSLKKENGSLSNVSISMADNKLVEFGQNATEMALNKSLSIQEENKSFLLSGRKEILHYYLHIPKAGGYGMGQLLHRLTNPFVDDLPEELKFRLCNVGIKPIKRFQEIYPRRLGRRKCLMWMAEDVYIKEAKYTYTIVRDPSAHVISQFFHCKESHNHRESAHFMPTLDEWLDEWAEAIDNPAKIRENDKFNCYNPINHQSRLLNYTEEKNDLKDRFNLIGDLSQMEKSACAIFIRYTGLFPQQCDCTSRSRRQLVAHDHGVTHHGDTFKLTPNQAKMIAKLTEMDEKLYDEGRHVFRKQVDEIEKEFGKKVCDNFRSDAEI